MFSQHSYNQLGTQTKQPVGHLVIKNFGGTLVTLNRDLANLLGIKRNLQTITYAKRLTSPMTYFIHCDLLDKTTNFLNGKRSDVLARFDIKGLPYSKISYYSTPQKMCCVTAP